MKSIIWKMPVPTSGLSTPKFRELTKHNCSIICASEEEDGIDLSIVFEGVEAYKSTLYRAITVQMREASYDELVDVGESDWLLTVRKQMDKYDIEATRLRHLVICFDDGPCYEIICKAFQIEGTIVTV